jgi:hypothetical protein
MFFVLLPSLLLSLVLSVVLTLLLNVFLHLMFAPLLLVGAILFFGFMGLARLFAV